MLLANQVDGIIAGAHNLGIEEYQELGLQIRRGGFTFMDNKIEKSSGKIRTINKVSAYTLLISFN